MNRSTLLILMFAAIPSSFMGKEMYVHNAELLYLYERSIQSAHSVKLEKAVDEAIEIYSCDRYGWCKSDGGYVKRMHIKKRQSTTTVSKPKRAIESKEMYVHNAALLYLYERAIQSANNVKLEKDVDEAITIYSCDRYGWCKTDGGYVKRMHIKKRQSEAKITAPKAPLVAKTEETPVGSLTRAIEQKDIKTVDEVTYLEGNLTIPNIGWIVRGEVTIYGSDSSYIEVSNNNIPLFFIEEGGELKLSNLKIEDLKLYSNIIENRGTLILENVTVKDINLDFYSLIENYGEVWINYSSIENVATGSFHGSIKNYGKLSINSSSFHKNSSEGDGGVIYSDGELEVLNSTFSENSAIRGGGLFIDRGEAKLSFSTIAFNDSHEGGGVFNAFAEVLLKNTLLVDNKSTDCFGEIKSLGGLIVANSSECQFIKSESDLIDEKADLLEYIKADESLAGFYVLNHNSLAYGLADNLDANGNGIGFDITGNIYEERVTSGAYEYDANSAICNSSLKSDLKVEGTLFIPNPKEIDRVRLFTHTEDEKEICYQDLYIGDSSFFTYSLGVNSEDNFVGYQVFGSGSGKTTFNKIQNGEAHIEVGSDD